MEELKQISVERTSLVRVEPSPGAEASEKTADKSVRDRYMESDRRRDWIMADAAFVPGIRKALTYARQGVSAFKIIQLKYNKFWRD